MIRRLGQSDTGFHVALAAIVLGAAALRFWNLGDGIPYAVGVDEPEIVERAVRMMKTGDLNPHFFDWPSLTIYLNLAASVVTFLLGSMRGAWSNLDQIGAAQMFFAGRVVSALLGSATVWFTGLVGRRWGAAEGLMAALLMAVVPYHVRESHYALADVPTACFTTLTFLLALYARERQTLTTFMFAGLAAGLAATNKYNGSMAILLPLIATTAGTWSFGLWLQRVAVVVGMAAVGFVAGTPYAILDLPKFLNDYARLAAIFARERGGDPGWSIYLKHLRGALGWPALILMFGGLALSAFRVVWGPERARWAMPIVFGSVYFAVMAGSYQIYGRYVLPLLPVAALLSAACALALIRSLGRFAGTRASAAAAVLVLAVAVADPLWTSVDFDRGLARVSTVDQAYEWLRRELPDGAKVVTERRVLLLPSPPYETENIPSLIRRSYDDYLNEGVGYLVSTGYEAAFDDPVTRRDEYVAYRQLFERATLLATFLRSADVEGPEIAIYKLAR